jgi:capsular polysaccharide biosynthesis protein
MALAPITPRDRLSRLVDLGQKALRYWWLVAVCAVVGGGLSLAFSLTMSRRYDSWAVLYYQERIQSSVFNRQEEVQRNLGDRFRELLLARTQLAQIVEDPKLSAFGSIDEELAIDKLRNAIRFEARGGNNFRITYSDMDPDRAKAVVERLTKLLQDKDNSLRNDQAQLTVTFATQQKDEAANDLRAREQELAEFLAKHPEFAQDPATQNGGGEGASIRAIRNQKAPVVVGNARLYALERQRMRLQARLDAPPDAPPIKMPAPPSPERIAAEAAVADAQRELTAANRNLEELNAKYTDQHPAVKAGQERVATAQARLRHAQAAVPADAPVILAPATPADRTKLQKDLNIIESQIADEQARAKGAQGSAAGAGSAAADATKWIVDLETQHAELRRALSEQRERVGALADSVFRAQIDASGKVAETGGRLSVVDPAFRPARPSGPGNTIFLLAGLVLFLGVGATFAIGLALIDDRLYRRDDIDELGLAVLAVIPPPAKVKQ